MAGRLLITLPPKPLEHRHSGQDYQQSVKRIGPVGPEGVIEKHSCYRDEQGWDERITKHAIGPRSVGIAPAENEHGAAGDHVEQPFGEDGEGKKLAKISSQKQEG